MGCPEDWAWFKAYVTAPTTQDARGIIGYMGGRPAAAVVFQNWTEGSVEVHQLITRPMILRHGWFETMAEAGFGESRQTMYGIVPDSNAASINLAKKAGFEVLARIPHGCRLNEDCVILTLSRGKCRYLKEK